METRSNRRGSCHTDTHKKFICINHMSLYDARSGAPTVGSARCGVSRSLRQIRDMTRDYPEEETTGSEPGSSAELDSTKGSLRADWTQSGHPSLTIVELVSEVTNRESDQLPALHEYVDGEALDALVTSAYCDSGASASLRLSFVYDGIQVTIEDGTVTVPLDSASRERE